MQPEALAVVTAWGFTVKSEIVWPKQTTTGKRCFGMGRQVRAEHETCLIATRGRPAVRSKSVRSTFAAKVWRHSERPDALFEIVERLCDGPYVELFARRQRQGRTCRGDGMPSGAGHVANSSVQSGVPGAASAVVTRTTGLTCGTLGL